MVLKTLCFSLFINALLEQLEKDNRTILSLRVTWPLFFLLNPSQEIDHQTSVTPYVVTDLAILGLSLLMVGVLPFSQTNVVTSIVPLLAILIRSGSVFCRTIFLPSR
jgi:hypothetical protein